MFPQTMSEHSPDDIRIKSAKSDSNGKSKLNCIQCGLHEDITDHRSGFHCSVRDEN